MKATMGANGQSLEALYPRLLHFGVSYGDLLRIPDEHHPDPGAWSRSLAGQAAGYEAAAEESWRRRRTVSAMDGWRRAADYFHYAQIRVPDFGEKQRLQSRCRQNYSRLAPLLDPPAVRIEVPYRSRALPCYLRRARAGSPCVILIGGLDSEKEVELHYFAEVFLRRGNSVLYFDGPGQGELCGRLPMTVDFEEAVSTVVDFLSTSAPIERRRVGLFGVSFGGHLACRAAAADRRISACVSLGGFFDAKIFRRLSPLAAAVFKHTFGLGADEELRGLAPQITLEPMRGRMDRPLLIVHGRDDHLVDLEQVEAMVEWACGPKTVWVMDGAEHVCTNRFGECLPRVGDWLTERLAGLNGGQAVYVEGGEAYAQEVC